MEKPGGWGASCGGLGGKLLTSHNWGLPKSQEGERWLEGVNPFDVKGWWKAREKRFHSNEVTVQATACLPRRGAGQEGQARASHHDWESLGEAWGVGAAQAWSCHHCKGLAFRWCRVGEGGADRTGGEFPKILTSAKVLFSLFGWLFFIQFGWVLVRYPEFKSCFCRFISCDTT